MNKPSLIIFLFSALTGFALFNSTLNAAESSEGFPARAAEAVKKAKATIKGKGLQPGLKEYEEAAIKLRADFPKRPEPWAMLLEVAINLDYQDDHLQPERKMKGGEETQLKTIVHVRKLLSDINRSTIAHETTKERARLELVRLDRLGKPLTLEFDALLIDLKSGLPRQVPFQIKDHPGKVILVHFWSTQSGPCIADLPLLKQARAKHPKDKIEIVGISLDENSARLRKFLKENQMDWPQHFDGRGWDNRFATEFGITSIPTQWLIDRQGNLRALNARHNLEKKIAVLVNEKSATKTTGNNATAPKPDEKTDPKEK